MSIHYMELNPWHKRQATLLYHFASLPYVRGLLGQIDQLIDFTDSLIDERSGLDSQGRALANWQPVDTAGHFSTYAFPALIDFRESVIKNIARRAYESYDEVGEGQCSQMLTEYAYKMLWASKEQETLFKERAESTFRYAGLISGMMSRPTTWNDFIFWLLWQEHGQHFARIPRFRIRTDVVCASGQVPPRTGVYVPQDDPMSALQFGWTGGYGELGNTYTLNEFGLLALHQVGRAGLWSDSPGLHRLINEPKHRQLPNIYDIELEHEKLAAAAVSRQGFEARTCEWYFVEMVNDEYEDHDGSYTGTASAATSIRPHRVTGGELVPQSGWWYTPANMGSTRYFKKDDRFPQLEGNEFGTTFWIWSPDQSAPKLG